MRATTSQGFTLLELMMTLAVLAVLVGLAAPTFREFTSNSRVVAAQNDLVTALSLTRSEALKRGTTVTMCPSADGKACGLATDWVAGWIVFQNSGAPGVIASPDDVIQKWAGPGANVLLESGSDYLQYQPTGLATASGTLDISYSGCSGTRLRHVQVTAGGTVTTQQRPCT